jgi:hypothetical protein
LVDQRIHRFRKMMQCGPQLEIKRTFLEFDIHTAVKVAGRRRAFSVGEMPEVSIAKHKLATKFDEIQEEIDTEVSSTSAGSSRSRTPSPEYSRAASPQRTMEQHSVSMPQPCFFWVPVMAPQFPQQHVPTGVSVALQARKAEFGSSVAQLAEAALQAEAAMGAVENGGRRMRGSATQQQHRAPAAARCTNTTIMLRNVPRALTRTMLLAELASQGFAGKFDFVYLPMDFDETTRCGQNFGHAFVNFIYPQDAARARECFSGFAAWAVECEKPCEALWREQCQGLAAHIHKYRNSALMHESVPDENKPTMFVDGVRCAFPAPTQPIKAPKMRRSPPCL